MIERAPKPDHHSLLWVLMYLITSHTQDFNYVLTYMSFPNILAPLGLTAQVTSIPSEKSWPHSRYSLCMHFRKSFGCAAGCETLLPGLEIEPVSPALAVLSLNHWTISEVSRCMLMSGWKLPFWSLTPVLQIQIYSTFLSPALHLRGANPSRLHLQLSNCLPSGFRQEETVAGDWRAGGREQTGMFCNGWLPSLWTPALLHRLRWVQLLLGDTSSGSLVIQLLLLSL